ncbi:glycine betaine ABC transporter substrate-binding protein [Alkalibacillus haloalkaliphilus]|uniref:glycine betaine ABC transporter substrate-binding protein n=1 Tax=Alkalibacillus haloalkaliphilus TaxID=94136 RepID=UPI0029366CF8|nr:glycine betaine ABC transporter substrate-binding protein [Alkalibacillus haloalkaliphilus]MDV2581823.1 glycine betaine ABC transporter substrate-binding protein [Alkalibacillus haloalkaliphilus]
MKKLFITLTALALVVLAACGNGEDQDSNGDSAEVEEKGTLTFGVTPWTSTVPPTKVAKLVLEDMGYEIEETQADVSSTFMGLSRGDIDIFMDSWMPVHEIYFDEYEDSVENVATSYDNADAGLVVPTYVDDIETVEDLKGNEDMFGNEIYGIEDGASVTETIDEFIEAYDLDFEQVNSSEGGMIAQAQRMMNNEEPVIFYGWRPHTMFNEFDLKIVEEPAADYFEQSTVHVVTNSELANDHPEAYEFLSNWSIPIDDVEAMIVEIEDGADEEEVAQEWIDNNQDHIDEMLEN